MRTGETIGARWSEVDLDRRLWVIPAERMKMEIKHSVPLSEPAVAILREMKAAQTEDSFGPHPFVFPGQKPRQGLSNMAMEMVMRRMKVDRYTVHGFRSTFRTWATEKAKADYGVAESALTHKVGTKVSQSYDHSDRFQLRVALMGQWADWLEHDGREKTAAKAAEIVPFKAQAAE
ncbi:MAG TPA: site-specific integrase [Roseiarcus sp.]|nr:site-specific integrase [Roseiarcus sp.]